MRVNSLNIIIMVLTLISSGVFMYLYHKEGESDIQLYWPCVILPINIILSYLAIRKIGEDEALVRSLDRLR